MEAAKQNAALSTLRIFERFSNDKGVHSPQRARRTSKAGSDKEVNAKTARSFARALYTTRFDARVTATRLLNAFNKRAVTHHVCRQTRVTRVSPPNRGTQRWRSFISGVSLARPASREPPPSPLPPAPSRHSTTSSITCEAYTLARLTQIRTQTPDFTST